MKAVQWKPIEEFIDNLKSENVIICNKRVASKLRKEPTLLNYQIKGVPDLRRIYRLKIQKYDQKDLAETKE